VITPTSPTPPATQVQSTARKVLAYGEALLAVAVAGVLSWILRDDLVATRLLLFWVASAYAAWRCGQGPALVAAVASVIVANLTVTRPVGQADFPAPEELTSALIFILVAGLLGATFDRLRRMRAESIETARQLSIASEQLQDQAIELENQLEESHVMAEELEHANEELGALSFANEHARRQLEQALERYRALIEASTAVVWTADPAG
jgi:K+-sensing histidine kinase KdpD